MSDSHAEALGQARIDIARLEVQVEHLTQSLTELSANVATMNTILTEAKGGWKALMAVGTAAGLLGSGLTWVIQHFNR